MTEFDTGATQDPARVEAAAAGQTDVVGDVLTLAAHSAGRLSLALVDASISLLCTPERSSLSAARHLAAVAATSTAAAVQISACLAPALPQRSEPEERPR